ncbi:MAG: alpha/beta hydrolase [Halioglobus sp.]|nr:alpha/beta hydrolase [Halioglobus sp.]
MLCLGACVDLSAGRPGEPALAAGWRGEPLRAGEFTLRLFGPDIPADVPRLHVYLGGDGLAFSSRFGVSRDPTPRRHLGLRLAAADPAPAVFLARPCYYGAATEPPCGPELWTLQRYAPVVVDAVLAALTDIGRRHPQAAITLVGYSGGGVVALLAARQHPRVDTVVTIAAPLDVAAWTRLHDYTPLAPGSDPARLPGWPARLRQVHLVGVDDVQVPPAIAESFVQSPGARGAAIRLLRQPGYDHRCCWVEHWPRLLGQVGLR